MKAYQIQDTVGMITVIYADTTREAIDKYERINGFNNWITAGLYSPQTADRAETPGATGLRETEQEEPDQNQLPLFDE